MNYYAYKVYYDGTGTYYGWRDSYAALYSLLIEELNNDNTIEYFRVTEGDNKDTAQYYSRVEREIEETTTTTTTTTAETTTTTTTTEAPAKLYSYTIYYVDGIEDTNTFDPGVNLDWVEYEISHQGYIANENILKIVINYGNEYVKTIICRGSEIDASTPTPTATLGYNVYAIWEHGEHQFRYATNTYEDAYDWAIKNIQTIADYAYMEIWNGIYPYGTYLTTVSKDTPGPSPTPTPTSTPTPTPSPSPTPTPTPTVTPTQTTTDRSSTSDIPSTSVIPSIVSLDIKFEAKQISTSIANNLWITWDNETGPIELKNLYSTDIITVNYIIGKSGNKYINHVDYDFVSSENPGTQISSIIVLNPNMVSDVTGNTEIITVNMSSTKFVEPKQNISVVHDTISDKYYKFHAKELVMSYDNIIYKDNKPYFRIRVGNDKYCYVAASGINIPTPTPTGTGTPTPTGGSTSSAPSTSAAPSNTYDVIYYEDYFTPVIAYTSDNYDDARNWAGNNVDRLPGNAVEIWHNGELLERITV